MEDCIHANSTLIDNKFPASVGGQCRTCGCKTLYINVAMTDYPDRIELPAVGVTLWKEGAGDHEQS